MGLLAVFKRGSREGFLAGNGAAVFTDCVCFVRGRKEDGPGKGALGSAPYNYIVEAGVGEEGDTFFSTLPNLVVAV